MYISENQAQTILNEQLMFSNVTCVCKEEHKFTLLYLNLIMDRLHIVFKSSIMSQ